MADDSSRHSAESEQEDAQAAEVTEDNQEGPSGSKRVKIQWQETLINLVAAQQEQLAELTRQAKMATASTSASTPPPNISEGSMDAPVQTATHAQTAFKVTSHDPSRSAYSIEEWLEDVTKLKNELHISDLLMISKAGEALRGKAHRFFCDWRPLCRNWESFCNDLIIAFPDSQTPGARAYSAATLRSRECESLCDYGQRKLRLIHRFYSDLPWTTIISMVEYGLDEAEVHSAIKVQKPGSERDLLKMLSEFDARHNRISATVTRTAERRMKERWNPSRDKPRVNIKRLCFNCGRPGHQKAACPDIPKEETAKSSAPDRTQTSNIPSCTHCKKLGHTEATCFYKHGRPKKAFVFRK